MRRLLLSLITPLFVSSLLTSGTAYARTDNVERWVASDLSNYVSEQLRDLPRFRDVTVQVVVLDGNEPATRTDALSARLRDDLKRRISERDGVRIVWRSSSGSSNALPRTGADCEALRADVLLGLETESFSGGRWRVSLRALDIVERTWIPRVSLEWRGELTRSQQLAARQIVADDSLRGHRDLPFGANQPDLIATRLAQDLRCELMRQTGGEYRIPAGKPDLNDPVLDLVRHQIGGLGQLDLIAGPGRDNAVLTSALHTVDAGLSQYWVRLTPTDAESELRSISASVYVDAPMSPNGIMSGVTSDGMIADAAVEADQVPPITSLRSGSTDILSSVALIQTTRGGECGYRDARAYGQRARQISCGALRLDTDVDAFVFVMNYQLQRGLVRVGPGDCSFRQAPEVVRAGETTIVSLPDSGIARDWTALDRWSSAPGTDAYYAVAVTNGRAAREIAAHVKKLPARCSESMRAGLRGPELATWLRTLEGQLARWGSATDWRAIELQRLY